MLPGFPERAAVLRTKLTLKSTGVSLALFLAALGLVSCRTAPPLPPVDLTANGWNVRPGQAVWQRNPRAPAITGELLVATHPDGRTWLQFTKTPVPILTAQTAPGRWRIEFDPQRRVVAGAGSPPDRLIWLHLAGCLGGAAPPPGWSFTRPAAQRWRLENPRTGERIEGCFLP